MPVAWYEEAVAGLPIATLVPLTAGGTTRKDSLWMPLETSLFQIPSAES